MKILFIGDIFGRPGRNAVESIVRKYRNEHKIDLVVANAENMKHGKGASEENLNDMMDAGVDFFTSGNHIFDDRELHAFMDSPQLPLVRPANYPPNVPGRGYDIFETENGKRVLIINLLGRLFIHEHLDCPFRLMDRILDEHRKLKLDAILVDFHAEATSEKMALGHYLDGRITALLGTHTHVATADARVLPKGTAFQTDVGFTGPLDSVIGVKKEIIIEHFLTQLKVKHEVAEGPVIFNATEVTTNDDNLLAKTIKPVIITIDQD